MKVRNLEKNGKNVANQFIITEGTTIAFQSYDTLICEVHFTSAYIKINKEAFLYSVTTSKHFMDFLEEVFNYNHRWSRKEIEKWIKSGTTEKLPMYNQEFNVIIF